MTRMGDRSFLLFVFRRLDRFEGGVGAVISAERVLVFGKGRFSELRQPEQPLLPPPLLQKISTKRREPTRVITINKCGLFIRLNPEKRWKCSRSTSGWTSRH